MTNGELFKLPKFPSQFTPEDEQRIRELERLAQEQRRIRGITFAPGVWGKKPWIERAARKVAEVGYVPEWFGKEAAERWRRLTPWTEYGFTPEQADVIVRETEAELQELRRLQQVSERTPKIVNYLTAMALQRLLSGEEAQLYELIPELNPRASPLERLDLSEEERQWFINYNKFIADKSKEQIEEFYTRGFPAPKSMKELMELVDVMMPQIDPRFILSTVAFSKDIEQISQALQLAYPPQTGMTFEEVQYERIKTEMKEKGITPSGDWKEDIKKLQQADIEKLKIEGKPTQITLPDGQKIAITEKEDGYYAQDSFNQDVKIANKDSEGRAISLTEAEEFELDNTPPPVDRAVAQTIYYLKGMFLAITDEEINNFFAARGDKQLLEAWCVRVMGTVPKPGFFNMIAKWSREDLPSPSLATEVKMAYDAGWGDILFQLGKAADIWLGADGIAEILVEEGAKLQRVMPQVADLSDFNWKNMFNPRYWTTPQFRAVFLQVVRAVPFSLCLLPAALIGWAGGAAVAGAVAVRIGLGFFGRAILTGVFGGIAGASVARPMESAFEAAGAYDQAKRMGASDIEADIVADKVFWDNMKLLGLDAVEIAAALAPIPTPLKVMKGGITRGLFRTARVGGRMTIVGLSEGGEEYYQTAISRIAMGEEDPWRFDPEAQLAATIGGIMGLGMGAGGDVLSGIINQTKDNILPTQKGTFDKNVEKHGEAEALNKLAETPEGAKLVEDIVEVVKEQEINKEIKAPKKRVHTKELEFNKSRLRLLEKETAPIQESHRIQSERLTKMQGAKAPTYEIKELQETISGLEKMLSELNTQRTEFQTKIAELEKVAPVAPVTPGIVPEVVIGTGEEKILSILSDKPLHRDEIATQTGLGYPPTSVALTTLELAGKVRNVGGDNWVRIVPITPGVIAEPSVFKEAPKPEPTEAGEIAMLEGRDIDQEVAEKQSKATEGLQETTIEEVARTAREVLAHIERHFWAADTANPLDRAATAAWKLGSVSEFVNRLPPSIWDNVSQEFKDANFQETSEANLNSIDTIRAFAFMDWGRFGGVARRKILGVTERLHLAYYNIYGVYENKYHALEIITGFEKLRPSFLHSMKKAQFHNDTWDLMEAMRTEDIAIETSELLQRGNIKNAIGKYTTEEQQVMVRWAKEIRNLWDEVLADQNSVRVKIGLPAIPAIEGYASWVYQPNLWSRLMGQFFDNRMRPDFVRDPATTPDYIKPSEPFVPHALAREGGLAGYTKVKDIRRLFLDYADTACRDMFFTPIIQNAKAHIKVLREKGNDNLAMWMTDWVTEGYAGSQRWISKAIRKSPLRPLVRPMIWVRRRLTAAVFPLNWTWNFFVQTSSIALTVGQYGIKNTILASQYLWNPSIRQLINRECYSYIIKQRRIGSLIYQDLGATISRTETARRSPLETTEQAMNFLTRVIETNITGLSCYAAYLRGQQMGMSERALVDYASEGGAKTQSMYNLQNVPGILRSPEVGATVPFQTFCFEAMNFSRELTGVKYLRVGAYETIAAKTPEGQALIQNRLKYFFEFIAAVYVMNILGELAIDRKPWVASSFVPFFGIMMIGLEPYKTWQYPLPIRYVSEWDRARNAYFEYGNWEPMIHWVIRYHSPGGVQIERTLTGIVSSIEGEVKDVSGEVMFELEPGEWIRAITMGIYQTESGREYRRRMQGADKTTDRILKDMDKMEEQLGESVEGQYYTLRDYMTEGLSLIRTEGIPRWQVLDEAMGYPDLIRFAVYSEILLEEYRKVPAVQHLNYRRDNPYVDAILYFWEQIKRLRSNKAEEELEKLFGEFGVGDNPRAHWRGLPVIPDWVKLLPE